MVFYHPLKTEKKKRSVSRGTGGLCKTFAAHLDGNMGRDQWTLPWQPRVQLQVPVSGGLLLLLDTAEPQ